MHQGRRDERQRLQSINIRDDDGCIGGRCRSGTCLGGKWLRGHHRVKGSEAKMGGLARNGSKQKQHAETWEGAASQGAMGVPGTTAVTADVMGASLWEPSWWTGTGQGTVRSPWRKGHSGREQQIGGGKFGSRRSVRVSCRNWGEP